MPRAKSVVTGKARKKKVLKANKGAFHGRRKLLRTAKENMWRGLNYAYQGRKQKKRVFRSLWILRINAAARNLRHELQPAHRRDEGGRDRHRPQEPRRPRRP